VLARASGKKSDVALPLLCGAFEAQPTASRVLTQRWWAWAPEGAKVSAIPCQCCPRYVLSLHEISLRTTCGCLRHARPWSEGRASGV
jgi:hypothetical protein